MRRGPVLMVLLLTAGCHFPVQERIDHRVCGLARHPRDTFPMSVAKQNNSIFPLLPAHTSQPVAQPTPKKPSPLKKKEPSTPLPPPRKLRDCEGGKIQSVQHVTKAAQSKPTTQDSNKQPKNQLSIPEALLPGGPVPRIQVPPLSEDRKKRKQVLDKLYPPLPGYDQAAHPMLGPEGKPMTLADLQRLAMSNSPLIRQAVAEVEARRGAAIQAGLPPNPRVGYQSDTAGTNGTAGYQGAFLEQIIKTGNKLQLQRAAAMMEVRKAELALKETEVEVMTRVRSGYYAVLVAHERVRLQRALARFTDQVYQVQVKQVRSGGFAAPYEPLYLRVLAMQARAQLVRAHNRYTSAWKQLAAHIGLPGMAPFSPLAPLSNGGTFHSRAPAARPKDSRYARKDSRCARPALIKPGKLDERRERRAHMTGDEVFPPLAPLERGESRGGRPSTILLGPCPMVDGRPSRRPPVSPPVLAGSVTAPIPRYDYQQLLEHILQYHTRAQSAEAQVQQARYALRLEQVQTIPDVGLRLAVLKDFTAPPNLINHSVELGIPLPVWNRNQGGIMEAQARLVKASEAAHLARTTLSAELAQVFERYENSRTLLGYYRDHIIPDQVRVYRGVYRGYQAAPAPEKGSSPNLGDVIVAQQVLAEAISNYLDTLGQFWQAVVEVAQLTQSPQLYQIGKHPVPTGCALAIPLLAPLPCHHPCSPKPDLHQKLRLPDPHWKHPEASPPAIKIKEALQEN